MMNLRVVQGPLKPHENEVILSEYNRLTSSQIPMQDFLHWVQGSPAGPSWHAIFETDEGQIVGHSCLIPLRGQCNGTRMVPAKSEYGFILEEFRTAKVRGFENMPRPRQIIMLDQLFRQSRSAGWGPFLISGSRALQRFGPRAECYRVAFPLWECLLVLRPWTAALNTPNISRLQRSLLGLIGVPQNLGWSLASHLSIRDNGTRLAPIDNFVSAMADARLSFFEDKDSLRWRYWADQYERLALDTKGEQYVIVKKGTPNSYLRVCQWKITSDDQATFSLVAKLVQMAYREKALGVRWAVYGEDEPANRLARRIRRFGFLTAKRVRTVLIQSKEHEFLEPENWNLNDAMFCFDF
jgi:hypothetical protein